MSQPIDRKLRPANSLADQKGPNSLKDDFSDPLGGSDFKKSSTMKQSQQQQIPLNLKMEDKISVGSDKLNFISEKEFKYEKICWVCKIQFGKINERQHHCRLCSHSVCGVCSNKRVNENRACDLCFLKMKNVKGERRKKKLISLMKNFIKELSTNIKKGDNDYYKLKIKRDEEIKIAKESDERRQQEIQELKCRLAQMEGEQKKVKQRIEKEEDIINLKKSEKRKVIDLQSDIDLELKIKQDAVLLKQQTLENKSNQLQEVQRHKLEIQQTESFIRLPNYEKAKRNDAEKVCEALLYLDQNDLRNNIDHYNTLSNHNLFNASTSDSSVLIIPPSSPKNKQQVSSSKDKNESKNRGKEGNQQEYASSYNQAIISSETEETILSHTARTAKKEKRSGKEPGCFCD